MCGGGGAKSPKRKVDKMSSDDINKAFVAIDKWKDIAEDENNVIKAQIQEQLDESAKTAAQQKTALLKEQRLRAKLSAQQIKGSYRTTLGGGSFGGAKAMKTTRRKVMPKAPLQINTGSLLT